jgi:hypothetical protein
MPNETVPDRDETVRDDAAEYEPPAVESVLTADDLAREIHYAGS